MQTIRALQTTIMKGSLWDKHSNKIVFLEQDPFMEKLIISLLEQQMSCKAKYAIDWLDVADDVESSGLFASSSIYAIRDCSYFLKKPEELLKARVSRDNVLVLIYSSIDQQSPMWQLMSEDICFSPRLSLQQFQAAVNSKWALPAECCKAIAEVCNFDSERVFSELNKLSILAIATNRELGSVVMGAISDGLVAKNTEADVYEFADCVKSGNLAEAIELSASLSKASADALKLVGIVHESCKGELETPPRNKLLSERELSEKMELAHMLEMGIKSGLVDEDIARDFAMIELSIGKGGKRHGDIAI